VKISSRDFLIIDKGYRLAGFDELNFHYSIANEAHNEQNGANGSHKDPPSDNPFPLCASPVFSRNSTSNLALFHCVRLPCDNGIISVCGTGSTSPVDATCSRFSNPLDCKRKEGHMASTFNGSRYHTLMFRTGSRLSSSSDLPLLVDITFQ
jgi:hypothetical protein